MERERFSKIRIRTKVLGSIVKATFIELYRFPKPETNIPYV